MREREREKEESKNVDYMEEKQEDQWTKEKEVETLVTT
jgi:hypothetical protein